MTALPWHVTAMTAAPPVPCSLRPGAAAVRAMRWKGRLVPVCGGQERQLVSRHQGESCWPWARGRAPAARSASKAFPHQHRLIISRPPPAVARSLLPIQLVLPAQQCFLLAVRPKRPSLSQPGCQGRALSQPGCQGDALPLPLTLAPLHAQPAPNRRHAPLPDFLAQVAPTCHQQQEERLRRSRPPPCAYPTAAFLLEKDRLYYTQAHAAVSAANLFWECW